MKIAELQKKRAEAEARMNALLSIADPSDDQLNEVEAVQGEIRGMDRRMSLLLSGQSIVADGTQSVDTIPAPEVRGIEATEIRVGEDREAIKPFRTIGEQLLAIRRADTPNGQVDKRLLHIESRAATGANTYTDSEGGYLLQPTFSTEIFRAAVEYSPLAARCRSVQIGAGSDKLCWNAIEETSRATGSRFGGVRSYWADEADTVTASKPRFRKRELEIKKLMSLFYATDESVKDSVGLTSISGRAFPEEIAWVLDDAIVSGDGAGKPLGILATSSPAVSVSKETGQAAATIVFANLRKMWNRMIPSSRSNSIWVHNWDVENQLLAMEFPVGTGGVPAYLPPGGASVSPYSTLFGRPLVPVEQCPALGTVGDIMLVDMNEYLLLSKGDGIQTDVSMHVRFLYAEQVFRFIYYVNGCPIWNEALTPANSSDTRSPFVTLATRA